MTTQTLGSNITGFHSGMHKSCSGYARTERHHVLAAHEMLALPDENLSLTCVTGELWLTRDGDIEDYILGPGRRFVVRRGDRATVQALQPSRVRLAVA